MSEGNIFGEIPESLPAELFQTLAAGEDVIIERILSNGHSSPAGCYYEQDRDEWVILLRGSACLSFPASGEIRVLKPGDYLNIPAGLKHRVEWTDPNQPTIWLAVHYS